MTCFGEIIGLRGRREGGREERSVGRRDSTRRRRSGRGVGRGEEGVGVSCFGWVGEDGLRRRERGFGLVV